MSDYENRLNDNNLNLMNIMNIVSNLPDASGAGDVKLFDSIANMQADPNPVEDGLAIVYYSTGGPITENTEFQIANFPETVTLPSAVTDYINLQFRALDESITFDCFGQLSSNAFELDCYTDDGDISIQYESSDGINYTRSRFMKYNIEITGTEMDFDTIIIFGSRYGESTWNDAIGYFIQVGTSAFQGLYQYNNGYNLAKTQLDTSSEYVYEHTFYGNNGVETGTLQLNTGLNTKQVQFRRDIKNNYQVMGISDASNLFAKYNLYDQTNTSYFDASDLDLSDITNTSYMFYLCSNITDSIELNTTNVTNMCTMFGECYCISDTIPNISNFDTSNVNDMSNMFSTCNTLTSVPNLNTINVTNMYQMFIRCFNLTNIPNFDTSNVANMSYMFTCCANLTSIPNFDTSNVTNMSNMFYMCNNLANIPNFNTSNVTVMSNMFYDCTNLTTVPQLDTSDVTNIDGMLSGCSKLASVPNFNTSNVTSMLRMFFKCRNLTTVPQLDTSNVNDTMAYMFFACNNLSNESIQNIVNMCINATNIPSRCKNINNKNSYSPLYSTKFDNSYYQNRWAELDAAGWTY